MSRNAAERPLRILLTNNTIAARAGSELFLFDLATQLMRMGHLPVAYSTVLGEVAEELRRMTIPVVDDLRKLREAPDIIHGQHHLETMSAALYFPDIPVVSVCHGWIPWEETPPVFGSIARYVAVDDLCRERLLTTDGIDAGRVSTIYNFADLERFKRRPPLPQKPRSALVFSNNPTSVHEAIRQECIAHGIERVEIAGLASGRVVSEPELLLREFDVVFAKARAAIEALSTGCAVVVSDYSRIGGMVTSGNLDQMRRLNFGVRTLQRPIDRASVRLALENYNSADAAAVTDRMRSEASLSAAAEKYLAVYLETLKSAAHQSGLTDTKSTLREAARYLQFLGPFVKERYSFHHEAELLKVDKDAIASQRDAANAEISALSVQLISFQSELNMMRTTNQIESAGRAELTAIKSSRAWRAVQAYGRWKAKLTGR